QDIFSLLEKMLNVKIKCFENENSHQLFYNDRSNLSENLIVLVCSSEELADGNVVPNNPSNYFNWYPNHAVLNRSGITLTTWKESWSDGEREDTDEEEEEKVSGDEKNNATPRQRVPASPILAALGHFMAPLGTRPPVKNLHLTV